MKHLIDKAALVAEIQRRRKEWRYGSSTEAKFKREECDDILSFIGTLEAKEIGLDLGDPKGDKSSEYTVDTKTFEVKDDVVSNDTISNPLEISRHGNYHIGETLEEAANDYAHDLVHDDVFETFIAGAKWKKGNLWKNAQGDDLPEIDREVIVLTQHYPLEGSEYAVSFAHRPNPNGWDGKSVITGKVEHYTPKTYDKGGWNIPNVIWWLDLDLPIKGE